VLSFDRELSTRHLKEISMTGKKEAQRKRAEQLRKQIEELKSEKEGPPPKKVDSEIRPDESPKEYVERRMHELSEEGPEDQ